MSARITAAMCSAGRTLSDPRLAPDAATVAFVASGGGRSALVTVPVTGGPETVLSADSPPRRGWGVLDWLPDGSGLVYVGAGGDLHVQPAEGGPPRRLEATHGAAAPAVAPDGSRVAFTVDGRHAAVASLEEGGPWPVRLSAAPDFCVDPAWAARGDAVAWHQWDVPAMPWDDSCVALASPGSAPRRVDTPAGSAVAQPGYAPDGAALGFLCDAAGWLNLWVSAPDGSGARPLVEEPYEHGGPTWGGGARTWVWSPDGRRVAFTRNEAGFGALCIADVTTGAVTQVDRGVFAGLSWAADVLVALRSGARTPDQIVAYPGIAGGGDAAPARPAPARLTLARGPVAGFEAAGLVEPEIVEWPVAEVPGAGDTAHGRLFRAAGAGGEGDAPPPLVVWVHGGPTGQHQVVFNPRTAFLVARGWNVLQVDPRGSTGWGRAYAQAINGRWGDVDVADTMAAVQAAGDRGWGDVGRLALMGASSAGLTVLSVMARHPGLCAAGIDLYGVTDLFALHETTHRFEAHYNPILLGSLPGAAATWRDRSPMTHAGRIRDPLLVLHGDADEVVPVAQSERLVAAVSAAGAPVEFHVYAGEGHGWSRPETTADELTRIEAFLTRYVLRGPRT